jgi:hypothetical protein
MSQLELRVERSLLSCFYLLQKKLKTLVLPCIISCAARLLVMPVLRNVVCLLIIFSAANGTCLFPQVSGGVMNVSSLVALFSKLIAHNVKQVGVFSIT